MAQNQNNSKDLNDTIHFPCGKVMRNRFMLAPMTNTQSQEDGRLSDEEFRWLHKRAEGQFGLVMTCASNVQANGQCWPGQLGIYDDKQLLGHERLARAIRAEGSLAVLQLHHGGMRCPADLIGESPVAPSPNETEGARALSTAEVEQLRDDFITAAQRAQKAHYDGVEIHGAHGYILTQFLSSEHNQRKDQYGGSWENRRRLVLEIIDGIRETCGEEFLLGIRLSPERFGMQLSEIKELCELLIADGKIDFLDISLWDIYKDPITDTDDNRSLLEHFADLDYGKVKWTVAGKIYNGKDVQKALAAGMDFVTIGRSAILHHDFPKRVMENPDFEPIETPVTAEYLQKEGLSPKFIDYMRRWKGFVEEE